MRDVMFITFAVFAAALFALGQMFGNHRLWAAFHIFLLARVTLLSIKRRRIRTAFVE
ncbi:hypothetical protein GCM10007880_63980 [Mesorhizobium amorphae]|uniref:hypothetical protein n=1 Tax=Mesorhizobium amorphae TaxID=71433 RepID=UPI00235D8A70|nr:hypothetical protein [Mesorhizobium amorphae]GLR45880.1 hypothetical protein GCM10007880_63980 [Mesorhizobium amorphae]